MTLTVGSLFAGVGGFDLGLERAGMRVVWQSEIAPYACAVLRKHWPDVPNLGDIRAMRDVPYVDVICGGFPCQDISNAGKRAGIDGERSGLWREYARIVGEIRPRFVIVENVAALLGRGLSRVLGDLAEIGYDAEWHCIPASYVGALTVETGCGLWPTPTARDYKGASDGQNLDYSRLSSYLHFTLLPSFRTSYPHPLFVEAVMGYPRGWTELDASVTPSSRKSRKSSAGQS